MTKYIIINLLLFLCLTITLQLPPEDEKFPAQDRDNFEITKKAVEIIEKVEEKIEGKNENYSLMTQAENSKKDIYNFNTENTNFSPMQNPYLFQGDEMLTKNQAENLVDDVIEKARSYEIDLSGLLGENTRTKRKIQKDLNYTWEFPINYVVQGVDNEMVDTALKFIENETCVRFSKQKAIPSGQPGLKFVKGNGCWSYVGRSEESKFQDVSIGYGCTTVGTVQHETMHALGSTHEQSRADRDQYLTIVEQNVRPSLMYNFVKLNISNAIDYYIKYDYGSEMQYPRDSFSMNGKDTMVPKNQVFNKTLGLDIGLTFLDLKLINLYYCSENFTKKIKCYNGGYEDPNDNTRCKCVEGYSGNKCIQLPKPKKDCKTTLYHVTKDVKNITLEGEKNCLYHLKAPHGMKINITVTNTKIEPSYKNYCIKDNSLEVKFIADKTPTGALLCNEIKNLTISSENDHAIVHYRSKFLMNKMNIAFYAI